MPGLGGCEDMETGLVSLESLRKVSISVVMHVLLKLPERSAFNCGFCGSLDYFR